MKLQKVFLKQSHHLPEFLLFMKNLTNPIYRILLTIILAPET